MRKLFQLVGEISIAGIDLANKQMRVMDKEARKVQRSIATLGRNVEKTGKAMTKYITVPLAVAGAAVIKFGADFDKAMTSSLAIMGDLTEAMKKDMSDAARAVGKTTKFSATEAAEAFYFLASAGLDAARSIGALPLVAAFAQAGMFDLSLATSLLTDAQSALGLKVKDVAQNMENMVRVSDVLVKANTLADASVLEFSEALTTKAAAALKMLGKEVEEGVAVLAAFAEQGVKGAEAGTRLDIVLRDLQKASINNREAFIKANIAVFDAEGEMRNMADIISDLEGRFSGMSDEQKRAELMMLGFTDRSVAATVTLLGTSDAIREYEEKLRKAGGTTQEVSEKQLKNFWDQLNLVKKELIDVGLTLWEVIGPILTKKLIPALKKSIEPLKSLVEWFKGLNQATKETIMVVVAFAAAAGPFLLVLGKIIIATKALTSAILLQNAALLANPFALAAIAITAIGAAIYYTTKAWNDWKETIADDIATKQTSALKKNLEEIIPLYGELAAAAVAPMGKERFEEVNQKVKELETNLADLGMEFSGNFGERAVEAENVLSDLALTVTDLGDAIDRTADSVDEETEKINKSAVAGEKAKAIKEEQIALSKAMIQQRIAETDSLKAQEFQMLKLLNIEETEALAKVEGGEEAKQQIRELYNRKRVLLAEETSAKIKEIEDKSLEDNKKLEEERLKLLETKKQKIKNFFEVWAKEEDLFTQHQIENFFKLVNTLNDITSQMGAIVSQYYYNKNAELDNSEQKEIKAIENSLLNEEEKDEALAVIDKKFAAERTKLKREQAKKDKAIAVFGAIINTAAAVVQTFAQWGFPLGIIFGAIMGALGIAQIALIASEPLPMRRGAYVRGGRGGVQAEIGEGSQDEIVLPLKTGVQALADALIGKLNEIKLPETAMPRLALAGGGTMAAGGGSRSVENHFHIGTLIADESGIKELERRLNPYRISDEQRKGRLYHGSR